MNNNRGWGLRAELWICLVLTVAFIIAMILLNGVIKNLNDDININGSGTEEKDDSKKDNNTKIESETNNFDSEQTNNSSESGNVNYISLEDKMVKAAKNYYIKYFRDLDERVVVTVARLDTEDFLDDLEVNDVDCSGYVLIEQIDNEVKYYPYLKCGSLYETEGYDSALDNTDV